MMIQVPNHDNCDKGNRGIHWLAINQSIEQIVSDRDAADQALDTLVRPEPLRGHDQL